MTKKMLNKEQQEILLNFLLNIFKDTKSIYVKCDCSHSEQYYQICDLMMGLNIVSIKEDYGIQDPQNWKVKIEFLYPLRDLLDIDWKLGES